MAAVPLADSQKEVGKLQNHLSLLRQQYVKLQAKLSKTEEKYNALLAIHGGEDKSGQNFQLELIKQVGDLYNIEEYSDITIHYKGGQIFGHKLVLSVRSSAWCERPLSETQRLDIFEFRDDVVRCLFQWIYKDVVELPDNDDDDFTLQLVAAANKYQLNSLKEKCEQALMSHVTVSNCIRYYQTANDIGAMDLKNYCAELISNHWDDFETSHFEAIRAELVYEMFKSKSSYPLHMAIKHKREDVVFIYLVENSMSLSRTLNERDEITKDTPLGLALRLKQESIAKQLVGHGCDVNLPDDDGKCLLHHAIECDDDYGACFLIENGADVNYPTIVTKETPLHLACSRKENSRSSIISPGTDLLSMDILTLSGGMNNVTTSLINKGCNINAQDCLGRTPLHKAIESENESAFESIMSCSQRPDLTVRDSNGRTALWLALTHIPKDINLHDSTFAAKLLRHGCSPDYVDPLSGNSLLHAAAASGLETAGLFLVSHHAQLNIINNCGETPLHIAARNGLRDLVATLLSMGADPNVASYPSLSGLDDVQLGLDVNGSKDNSNTKQESIVAPPECGLRAPLHYAVLSKRINVVDCILKHKANTMSFGSSGLVISPNLNVRDEKDQTPLSLAVWIGEYDIALDLLRAGADIECQMSNGLTLLHCCILRNDLTGAMFLLRNSARIDIRTKQDKTILQMAIEKELGPVVENLCQLGADVNGADKDGNTPLWIALRSKQYDIASILVQNRCDTNAWSIGASGGRVNLLHRAISSIDEEAGCFLVRSGCDMNTQCILPSKDGKRISSPPIHLACKASMDKLLQSLFEHGVDVNTQDSVGRTATHVAIENKDGFITSFLLSHPAIDLSIRDTAGRTPFTVAMANKDTNSAATILARDPTAADQFDSRGRNFLHIAVLSDDNDAAAFLIGVNANLNSATRNSDQYTPLHLAAAKNSESICRSLLQAGANHDAVTGAGETALHLAATHNHTDIINALLEFNADSNKVDSDGNNALHLAVQEGNLEAIEVLMDKTQIDINAVNGKGRTPLIVLAKYNLEQAVSIFRVLTDLSFGLQLDAIDPDGNTALYFAYCNGNGNLCKALVLAGARIATVNTYGDSIFNFQTATKKLLHTLLDMIDKEPAWIDGTHCHNCMAKFTVTTRKHHCRHCGRVLCGKCSSRQVPILKFDITKPVRVCEICATVLTQSGY